MASTPIATGEPDADEESIAVCSMCLKQPSKYTCPRCNMHYCSVDCYRSDKHRDCSESFYRDCFMEGLKESSADPKDKQKVLEMLQRVEKGDATGEGLGLDSVEEDDEDLHARLADLDLDKDTDQIWDRLTEKEKKEFENMASDGRLGHLIEVWTPWWVARETDLVKEMAEEETVQKDMPAVRSDIPKISALLSKSKPSADMKYNILNVLYAYVFVCRLHNGDHRKRSLESAQDLMEVSEVIGQGRVCGSAGEAVQACFTRLQTAKRQLKSSLDCHLAVLTDVLSIIKGPNESDPLLYLMAATSDMYFLFKKANKAVLGQLNDTKKDSHKETLTSLKRTLFSCKKKAEFMLSWTQTYGMALQWLITELELEISALSSEVGMVTKSKEDLEAVWGGKVKPAEKKLIEEI